MSCRPNELNLPYAVNWILPYAVDPSMLYQSPPLTKLDNNIFIGVEITFLGQPPLTSLFLAQARLKYTVFAAFWDTYITDPRRLWGTLCGTCMADLEETISTTRWHQNNMATQNGGSLENTAEFPGMRVCIFWQYQLTEGIRNEGRGKIRDWGEKFCLHFLKL